MNNGKQKPIKPNQTPEHIQIARRALWAYAQERNSQDMPVRAIVITANGMVIYSLDFQTALANCEKALEEAQAKIASLEFERDRLAHEADTLRNQVDLAREALRYR
jgi:multidrug resistance efflux pump